MKKNLAILGLAASMLIVGGSFASYIDEWLNEAREQARGRFEVQAGLLREQIRTGQLEDRIALGARRIEAKQQELLEVEEQIERLRSRQERERIERRASIKIELLQGRQSNRPAGTRDEG